MSSGRGPGFIGLLLALLIVGGFGALYVLVFDSEMQGKGVTIESVIRGPYHSSFLGGTSSGCMISRKQVFKSSSSLQPRSRDQT